MAVHNEISFVLEQRPSLDVVRAVSTGEADIGISVCEVIPESLRSYPYHEDRLVAIVPENHPLADRTHVNFKELLTFDSVGLSQHCSMQLFLCKKAVDLGLPFFSNSSPLVSDMPLFLKKRWKRSPLIGDLRPSN